MKKKQVEMMLSGELQKAVWSLLWSRKEMRSSDIAKKLARRVDSVSHVLSKLVEFGAIESPQRGVFKVSEEVTK